MGLSPDRRRKDAFLSDARPRGARVALLASWRRTRAVWLLLALVAVAAAVDTVRLWQQQRRNRRCIDRVVPALLLPEAHRVDGRGDGNERQEQPDGARPSP